MKLIIRKTREHFKVRVRCAKEVREKWEEFSHNTGVSYNDFKRLDRFLKMIKGHENEEIIVQLVNIEFPFSNTKRIFKRYSCCLSGVEFPKICLEIKSDISLKEMKEKYPEYLI